MQKVCLIQNWFDGCIDESSLGIFDLVEGDVKEGQSLKHGGVGERFLTCCVLLAASIMMTFFLDNLQGD